MPRATYRGPGDYVELDNIRVHKGKAIELTWDQIQRIKVSDPAAVIDVARERGDNDASPV